MSERVDKPIAAVVFDKDGTLIDFHATWDMATFEAIVRVCPTQHDQKGLAAAIGYDFAHKKVLLDSPFVAESAATLDRLIEPWADPREFETAVVEAGARGVVAEPGAEQCVRDLRRLGIPVALATNDSAESANEQLAALGWAELFDAVLGYDSGFGAKPDPGMVLAAADQLGHPAEIVAMVGDSFTDIESGNAAGAVTVLYGDDERLRPLADFVVHDLGQLLATLRLA